VQKTILLVEDDVNDRNMYGNILWYNGYNILLAEDGEAGLRLAHEKHPDLIILDLRLPLMHGLEMNSRLKQDEETKDIPVIALTGRQLRELGGNAAVLGYARFLEKPVSPLQVLREVESLIGFADDDQAQQPQRPQVYRTHVPDPATQAGQPVHEAVSEETRKIAEHILENSETILTRWADLVKEEPWFSLPREHRMSNLPDVVTALVRASLLEPRHPEADKAAVLAGAEHGHNRRTQGIPESLIPIEFHLLRQALWRFLNDSLSPSDATYSAILGIDRSITLTLNAAMWGYYREEIEAHDGWDSAVERLVEGGGNPANRKTALDGA
jgi:two-component system, cell cycle response regulator DivK